MKPFVRGRIIHHEGSKCPLGRATGGYDRTHGNGAPVLSFRPISAYSPTRHGRHVRREQPQATLDQAVAQAYSVVVVSCGEAGPQYP